MNEMITIIVPMYNVEKTIEKTVYSLLNQKYSNLEIILIDDGSVDRTKEICNKLSKSDNRICFYSKNNNGPSAARQYGLDKANGRYIAFCDADDEMHPQMIEVLYNNLIKYKAHLSICSYFTKKDQQEPNEIILECLNNIECINQCLADLKIGGYLWNKLYDSEIIKAYNIRFDRTIFYCEDLEFTIMYLLHSSKAVYTNQRLYHYYFREDSLSSGDISWQKLTNIFARKKIVEILKKNKIYSAVTLAERQLVLQSVYAGRALEKASSNILNKFTNEQFDLVTKAIRYNCCHYGIRVLFKVNYSIKVKINIIKFIIKRKWKR